MFAASALYRSIAPWHPAVAWVWFASIAVGSATAIAHGAGSGVRGALAVFLCWAIVRELAPRRALPALLAPVAAVAFAIPGDTDLLACWCVLVAARVAAGTARATPTLLDLALLVPFAAFASTRPAGLPAAVVLSAVVFAVSHRPRFRVAGVGMLLASIGVGAVEGTLTARPGWDDPGSPAQVLLALAVAATAWLLAAPLPARLRARSDRGREHLRGQRVRAARAAVVASLLAAVGWTGLDGAFALSAAAGALLAAAAGARSRAATPSAGVASGAGAVATARR